MNIKHYISAAMLTLVGLSFTACDGKDEPKYTAAATPSADARVYFAKSTVQQPLETGSPEFTIPVYRPAEVSDHELTVQVLPSYAEEGDAEIFTVDPNVTFEAGETATEVTVTFDPEAIEPKVQYVIYLSIDDANANQYGIATTKVVCSLKEWDLVTDEAIYYDDLIPWLIDYQLPVDQLTVSVYKHMEQEGLYKIENPYATSEYVEAIGCDIDEGSIYFVVTDDNLVYFPYSEIGIIEEGEPWYIMSLSYYFMAAYELEVTQIPEEYFGTFNDGVVTMNPMNEDEGDTSFLLGFSPDEDPYAANFTFKLDLNGQSSNGVPAKKQAQKRTNSGIQKLTPRALKKAMRPLPRK